MISVILNVYKRPYTLEKQIESILNQSIEIKPENIHVWYNKVLQFLYCVKHLILQCSMMM
jgi:glycosyltransferase involved in cell wall biosynthesis